MLCQLAKLVQWTIDKTKRNIKVRSVSKTYTVEVSLVKVKKIMKA